MQSQHKPTLPSPAKRSFLNFVLVPAVVLALLVAASYVGIQWMQPGDSAKLIFHQTGGGWRQLPAPGGYPEIVRVSGRGTVWLRTWGPDGMSQWDGDRWRRTNNVDLAPKNSYWDSGFALDGEEVWLPTEHGVHHWDGKQWQAYSEAPASEGASIVAGDGQVSMIDRSGNFSQFKDGHWQSHKLALPGVDWTETRQYPSSPQLARTADGAVWLLRHRLWRFDGANWVSITVGTFHLDDA